jgi:serine/threonine-protein kinase
MAPERLLNKAYDGRSDVYSLGIVWYSMLCGRLPFVSETGESYALAFMHLTTEPPSLREFQPGIPADLDTLVRQTLSKEPKSRPEARELASLIRAVELS